jgi:hypothetical protein
MFKAKHSLSCRPSSPVELRFYQTKVKSFLWGALLWLRIGHLFVSAFAKLAINGLLQV